MMQTQSLRQRLIIAGGLAVVTLGAVAAGLPAARADVHVPAGAATTLLPDPPLIIAVLSPGGTELRAETLSTEPTTFSYFVTVTPTTVSPVGSGVAHLPGGDVFSDGSTPPPPQYDTKHNLHKTGLTPNTTYDLDVAGVTRSGVQLSAHRRFTTLKQRVRISLDKIVVSDDGDTFGSGEPTWFWQVGWATGTANDCYPEENGHCRVGSASEGTIYPYTDTGKTFAMVFAQENFLPVVNPHPQPGREDFTTMPRQFVLNVSAKEDDGIFGSLDAFFDWGAWLSGNPQTTWTAPQGVELARQSVTVSAEDGNFRSTMTFTFEVFYDNLVYTPNDGRVYSTSK